VTVKNISDRVFNRVDVMVHIWAYDGGIGHGAAWPNPLEPGATAVINLQSGRGSGTTERVIEYDDDRIAETGGGAGSIPTVLPPSNG
jgi:hypothetical protein